jgi:hypothetical protein
VCSQSLGFVLLGQRRCTMNNACSCPCTNQSPLVALIRDCVPGNRFVRCCRPPHDRG